MNDELSEKFIAVCKEYAAREVKEAVKAERQRILTLLSSFSDSPVIQQAIEIIHHQK